MKQLLIIAILFFITINSFSQDTIRFKDGSMKVCKILKCDSTSILYEFKREDGNTESSMTSRSEISTFTNSNRFDSKKDNGIAKKQKIQKDTITMETKFGDILFYKNGAKSSFYGVVKTMKSDEVAHTLMLKAQKRAQSSFVFECVGAIGIGCSIGTIIKSVKSDKKIYWQDIAGFGAVGATFICLSIPLHRKSVELSKKAIQIYNSESTNTSFKYSPLNAEFKITYCINQIGARLTF